MRRFTLTVIFISVLATCLWAATAPFARESTIQGAKWLHRLAGYPAPHLLADLDQFYWFAPLFPPFAGLVLASGQVPWRRRLTALVVGLAVFWYLVSAQIALVYSPYLTLSSVRGYFLAIQVGLNTVAVPVVLWLITIGGPPVFRSGAASSPQPITRTDAIAPPSWLAAGAWLVLFCVVMSLPVCLAAAQSNRNLDAARDRLGRSLVSQDLATAAAAIEKMLQEQRGNASLSYLQLQIHRQLGDFQSARESEVRALTTTKRRRVYHRQEPVPTPGAPRLHRPKTHP